MASTWSISRRTGTCAASGRVFEDGERHVSLLRVAEGALERVDLSTEAWREEQERIAAEGGAEPVLFWTTRHAVEAQGQRRGGRGHPMGRAAGSRGGVARGSGERCAVGVLRRGRPFEGREGVR